MLHCPLHQFTVAGNAQGKPAGVRCVHLSVEQLCQLFGQPQRPAVCSDFKADIEVCGNDQADAIRLIGWWEQMTAA